jgi:hypothetical protein
VSETEKGNAAPPPGDAPDTTKQAPPAASGPDAAVAAMAGGLAVDRQLIALCVGLWIVAVAIVLSSWGETRTNYYLGNIKQTLDRENRLDETSVEALAAMGDKALPQIVKDLETHDDPLFRIALLKVLERIPSEASRKAIADTSRADADARVRANAVKVLSDRAKKLGGDEREQAVACACDTAAKDPEWQARAIAAQILGELKDPRAEGPLLECLKSREEGLRKKAAEALKVLEPSGPELDASAAEDVRVRQAWEWQNFFRAKRGEPALPAPSPPAAISTATPADKKGLDQPVGPPAKPETGDKKK